MSDKVNDDRSWRMKRLPWMAHLTSRKLAAIFMFLETLQKQQAYLLTPPDPSVPHDPWWCWVIALGIWLGYYLCCIVLFDCKPLFKAHMSTQCVAFVFPSLCCVSKLHCKPLTSQTKGRGYGYFGGTIAVNGMWQWWAPFLWKDAAMYKYFTLFRLWN
jgi:hypothetical protein